MVVLEQACLCLQSHLPTASNISKQEGCTDNIPEWCSTPLDLRADS